MKAIIVTVVYVLGLFVGDWLHYGQTEAALLLQYNAVAYGGLALALIASDPRYSWRRIGAAMWACLGRLRHWLFIAIMAGPDCPKCNSYRTVAVHKSHYQCTCCGTYF